MQPQADPFIVPVCNEQIEVLYQDEPILLIHKATRLTTLYQEKELAGSVFVRFS